MIIDHSKHGGQNAIQATELTQLVGFATMLERESGSVILSGGAGFFLPSEDEQVSRGEIERFIASLSGGARSALGVLKAAKRPLRQLAAHPLNF